MPKFIVVDTFQFGGSVRQAGAILTIAKAELEAEIAKGKKKIKKADGTIVETKTWLSGILNHCEPEDEDAADSIDVKLAPKKSEEEIADEIEARVDEIYKEMDELGISYDRRWKLPRLENELVKAKKIRGE